MMRHPNSARALILLAAFLCIGDSRLCAQSPQALSFEVVSIKPDATGGTSNRTSIDKHRFVGTNLTIKNLILLAYKVQEYQIIGVPPALASLRFDIEAKADDQTKPEQIADMIKSMLVDRFKLRLHHENRELPVYALLPAKSGSKLKQNTTGSENHSSRTLRGKMYGQNMPIDTLVTLLSNELDRMVIDRTGLIGNFDWALEWSAEASRAAVAPDTGGPATEPTGPSIFTAVQEQLGLRLEATKAPLDALIIDGVEQPSEN